MKKLLLVLALAPAAFAQTPCDPAQAAANCTIGQAYNFYWSAAATKSGVQAVASQVVNSNRAQTAPTAFATEIHNSYQDYLNLFSFAINKVDQSSDGQALIVRFNPLREGSQVLGFTLTAAKPAISDAVKNAIPSTGRADTLSQINDKIPQLSDLTLSGSYALQTLHCGADRDPAVRCYGRAPSTYRGLLAVMMEPVLAQSAPGAPDNRAVKTAIAGALTDAAVTRLIDVYQANLVTDVKAGVDLRPQIQAFAEAGAAQSAADKAFFSKMNFAAVASLVDNQPQISAIGSYRTPGKYGGAKQIAASIELQVGMDNLNSLRASCPPGAAGCLQNALAAKMKNGVTTTKWVLTATYLRDEDYHLTDLGLAQPVAGFTPVNLPRTWELNVKGQGGAWLPSEVSGKRMRYDVALEGKRVQKDGVRTTSRWLASATLTVPLGDTLSVPVSINWANKPEFLGAQKKNLGANLGITYRLPGWTK